MKKRFWHLWFWENCSCASEGGGEFFDDEICGENVCEEKCDDKPDDIGIEFKFLE